MGFGQTDDTTMTGHVCWVVLPTNYSGLRLPTEIKGTQSAVAHAHYIRYYFLADLHVTRHAREKESEKRIRNTLNKPCRV